jgi:CelD/BcsL family acetyltransferase involved in cellulose biosynthesis
VTEPPAPARSVSSSVVVRGPAVSEEPSLESPAITLTGDVVIDVDGITTLSADYEQLYRVTGNSLPFALQEWHLAWCRNFLNRNPLIPEHPLFCVLRELSGECVAIVPLILTRRRLGPLKVATLALVGADPSLTEIRTPLIKPGYERLAVRAVHESLARVPDWDWIQWDRVSDALADALNRETIPRWYDAVEDFVLDLPTSWQEFRAGLKRNMRESLRHCYNSLRRDRHAFELVVAQRPAEIPRAVERFLELHGMRAAMAWGPRHANVFAGRAAREFLHEVCTSLAARDALRIFQLRIGEAIVASRIGFIAGETLYLYYSGFDPAWARYSVMTTTQVEAFKYAIAHGIRSVNLSLTAEQSKVRWRPRTVRFHSALVHRKLLRSRIVSAAYRAAVTRRGPTARMLSAVFWAHRDWE